MKIIKAIFIPMALGALFTLGVIFLVESKIPAGILDILLSIMAMIGYFGDLLKESR